MDAESPVSQNSKSDLDEDEHVEQDTLTWEDSYAIAQHLRRRFPAVSVDDVSISQIYAWTIELPAFQDDPDIANESILLSIYQEWFEEANSL